MPTYDSINTLKQDDKALGVEDIPETRSAPKSKPKKKSEGSSGGGLGSVLPSMNKSGPSGKKAKPPKAKKEVEKPKKAKPEPKAEFETMDMGLPSYSESAAAPERSVFAL